MRLELWRMVALAALSTLLAVGPADARHKLPEVSHDGLRPTKGTGFQAYYRKPGTTLTQYDKLVILDCFVAFKKHWWQDHAKVEALADLLRP